MTAPTIDRAALIAQLVAEREAIAAALDELGGDRLAATRYGFTNGYEAGWRDGRAALLAEARHRAAVDVVHGVASDPRWRAA